MSKYDFGWDLKNNPTNLWAYQKVFCGARVLELGAATGGLTRNLSEVKKCEVDIVEIDGESGIQAAQYANVAVLGESGDLDRFIWTESIKGEYDYIIILDVLEHLKFPENVLLCVKKYLKPGGELLLSIPNVAHNAVVAELLNDDFPYQDLGLLDNTHIHFFAYRSILRMLQNVDMCIKEWTAVGKTISDTEFGLSYENLEEDQAYLLKKRRYGNAYQYLMVVTRDAYHESVVRKPLKCGENKYKAQVLVNGLAINTVEKRATFGKQSFTIDLSRFKDVSSLRFIPCQFNAFIFNLSAKLSDSMGERAADYNWTTGVELDKGNICFFNSTSQEINFLIDGVHGKFEIQWECIPVLRPDGVNIAKQVLAFAKNRNEAVALQMERVKAAYELCDRVNEERNSALRTNAQLQNQLRDSEKQSQVNSMRVEQIKALLKETEEGLIQEKEKCRAESDARNIAEKEIDGFKKDLERAERELVSERTARSLMEEENGRLRKDLESIKKECASERAAKDSTERKIGRIQSSIDEHRIRTAFRIAFKKPIYEEQEEKSSGNG